MKQRKQYDDDDGRVIAPMNIEGMPWYDKRAPKLSVKRDADGEPEKSDYRSIEEEAPLSKKEERAILLGTLKAALLVGGIFAVCGLLFVLFCVFVWL